VVGRKLLDDGSGIVTIEKEVGFSYDPAGLATIRQSGTLTTVPGTSAEAKARSQAVASPGAAFGLETAGPESVNVRVLDATDTKASFETTWREHGVSLPAGVNDFSLVEETIESPEGSTTTIRVRGRGPSQGQLKTAIQAKKPSQALADARETEDKTGLAREATYVQRRPNALSQERTGFSKLVYHRREITVEGADPEGDERDLTVDLVPGFEPVFTKNPVGAKTITERVVARLRGTWNSLAEFKLEPRARSLEGAHPQPGATRRGGPVLEEIGLTRDADLWRAEVAYSFVAARVDPAAVAELGKEQ
jgi:hypothetical protein